MENPMIRTILALSLLAAPLAARAADSIRPGYWESKDTVVSPIHRVTVARRCITPKDVAKFMMGPSNHIYTCTYPEQSVAGGAMSFKGQCVQAAPCSN